MVLSLVGAASSSSAQSNVYSQNAGSFTVRIKDFSNAATISPVSGADVTNAFPFLRFAPVRIRVVDGSTSRPLVGALVSPHCLGGTPYGTNTYQTDTNGFVKAMFVDGGTVAVRVTMRGYETSNIVLPQTNRLVSMKRLQP